MMKVSKATVVVVVVVVVAASACVCVCVRVCVLVRVCVFVVSWLLFRGGFVRVWTYDRCVSSFVYCRVCLF